VTNARKQYPGHLFGMSVIMAKGQKNKKMIKKKPQKTLMEKRKAKREKKKTNNNDNIINQTNP
jgi:hypothetical protein